MVKPAGINFGSLVIFQPLGAVLQLKPTEKLWGGVIHGPTAGGAHQMSCNYSPAVCVWFWEYFDIHATFKMTETWTQRAATALQSPPLALKAAAEHSEKHPFSPTRAQFPAKII